MKKTEKSPPAGIAARIKTMGWRRKLVIGTGACLVVACGVKAGWLKNADYSYQPPVVQEHDEAVQGLTVLVSFSGEAVSEAQAALTFDALNKPSLGSDSGSVRDYFSDMSNKKFDLTNRVVHVTLSEPKSKFAKGLDVPNKSASQLVEITTTGPAVALLQAVVCRLHNCPDSSGVVQNTASWQEVTAAGFGSRRTDNLDYTNLSTRQFGFWFDSFFRDYTGNANLANRTFAKQAEIPSLEIYSFFNLFYAGARPGGTAKGEGLWPRSIPILKSVDAALTGGVHVGRVQLQAMERSSGTPMLNTLIHEAGHTLFDLPDLYDAGDEIGIKHGTDSSGIGGHGLMGNPGTNNELPLMSAPHRDQLGWADIVDITDSYEGRKITLDANGGRVARYCRPHSTYRECFYIEARHKSSGTKASGRTIATPGDGLVIWHTEERKDVSDYAVNNHETPDRNLHYQVAVMQADQKRDLENNRLADGDDYYRSTHPMPGYENAFDHFTTVSSDWWDGTPSGLAISNISAAGKTMSFVMGKRPTRQLHVNGDAHVSANVVSSEIAVGESRQLSFQADPGYRFDLEISGKNPVVRTGLTGLYRRYIGGESEDRQIRVVSYPDGSARTADALVDVDLAIGEGARVSTYADTAVTYETVSRKHHRDNLWVGFNPSGQVPADTAAEDPDMTLSLTASNPNLPVVARAEQGYVITSVRVQSTDGAFDVAFRSPTTYFAQDIALPVQNARYRVTVNTEPLRAYFCRTDVVAEWDHAKVYSDIGDLVRFDGDIYSANVPRAFLRANVDSNEKPVPVGSLKATPKDSATYWTPVMSCTNVETTCNAAAWEPGSSAAEVVHGGQRFTRYSASERRIPGGHAGVQREAAANLFAFVDRQMPLDNNRLFSYPASGGWRAEAACRNSASFRRAVITKAEGVKSVTPSAVDYNPSPANEPLFIQNLNGSFRFAFELETGYGLDDVYIDGVAMNLSSSARSVTVPYSSSSQAPYVEIRTTL